MKMKNIPYYIKLSLIMMLISYSLSMAQSEKDIYAPYWGNVGLGISSNTSGNYYFSISFQNDSYLTTFSITEIDSITGIIGTPRKEKSYLIIGGMYGVSTQNDDWHASISAGPSLLFRTITLNKFSKYGGFIFPEKIGEEKKRSISLGINLESQLFWKIGKVVGIGLKLFANVNPFETIGGFSINIIIGSLY